MGLLDLCGSEAVGQLLGEPEWLCVVDGAQQVPRAPRTPLLQHQPAGALSGRLLLRSLLRPFPLQPPGDEEEDGDGDATKTHSIILHIQGHRC